MEWMVDGCDEQVGRLWAMVHVCILHRCMPEQGTAARGQGWWSALVLTGIAQLVHGTRRCTERMRLRCTLRCLPPAMQSCIWQQHFDGPTWMFALAYLFKGLVYEGTGVAGCVYLLVDLTSAIWYIGKTKGRRSRHTTFLGVGVRLREHLAATFRPGNRKSSEQRYQMWRRSTPHRLCIIPCLWAEDRSLGPLEEAVIRQAQTPTQKQRWEADTGTPSALAEIPLEDLVGGRGAVQRTASGV